MATSLRDIPGANRARKPRRAEKGLRVPPRATTLDLTPGGMKLGRPKQPRFTRGRGARLDLFIVALVVGALGVVAWLAVAFWGATRVDVSTAGIDDGRALTPEAAAELDIVISFATSAELFRADLRVDGVALDDLEPEPDGASVRIRPAELVETEVVEQALAEGEHRIELAVSRPFLGDSTFQWTYVVDSIAPTLQVPPALDPVPIDEPVTVRGSIEEGARLTLAGEPVDVDGDAFAIDFDIPPTGALQLAAIDEAGNTTEASVVVPVLYPDSSRAVHVSGAAWANDELRTGVLDLIDRRLVDTVELDLKDESGLIGYESDLAVAKEIGAVSGDYDLAEAVRTLEAKGVRVIGRLVAFRDPVYASAAWADGRRDEVLQTPDGGKLGAYGGFSNYAHPAVREYNLSIALEAVELGVKDILWDYIRRPEGNPETMVVPGLEGTSSDSVTEFLDETHAALRAEGAYQGASVFGIAAAAGDSIAQDVPAMAAVVDYLAPMVYPSHWGPGMYRVPNPIKQPGEIVARSLADFQRVTEGTGVRILPWLQDFTLYGVPYGMAEVKAQIDAAASLGIDGFFLWNPNVRYTVDALTPIP